MTPETTVPTRRSPLWMRSLLAVSLALNLAVVGLAAGAALRLIGPGGPPPVSPGSLGGAMYRAMSPEDRHALVHEVRGSGSSRKNRREDAGRLAAMLRADPFDKAATQALLEEQVAMWADWQAALQNAWLTQVTAMPVEERQAYAARLEEVVKSRGNKGRPPGKAPKKGEPDGGAPATD